MKDFSSYAATNHIFYPEYWGEKHGDQNCREVYQHDKAEVNYSMNFRRMAFRQYHLIKKENDPEARTRLLHSIEVATIASNIARRFKLNIDLTEAIALGHDIAQPPCGYPADKVLHKLLTKRGTGEGFDHGKLASQILEWRSLKIEEEDPGRFKTLKELNYYKIILNHEKKYCVSTISKQTLDGISKHTPTPSGNKYSNPPLTLEGQIVRIADNIAYFTQEIDDALRQDTKNVLRILNDHSSQTKPLKNRKTGQVKSPYELKSGTDYVGADDNLLRDVFGHKQGPRLMSFIRRFVNYNLGLLNKGNLEFVPEKTEYCDSQQIPLLKYDENTDFLVDFLWDDVISEINKLPWVEERVEINKDKITRVFDHLLESPPNNSNYKLRKNEVDHYYSKLSDSLKDLRTNAHYIATLTDIEINEIYESVQ